jgi:hypothetical protein
MIDRERRRQALVQQTQQNIILPPATSSAPAVLVGGTTSATTSTPAPVIAEATSSLEVPSTSAKSSPFSALKQFSIEDFRVLLCLLSLLSQKRVFQATIDFIRVNVLEKCLYFIEWDRKFVLNFAEIVLIFNEDDEASSWVEDDFIKNIAKDLQELLSFLCSKGFDDRHIKPESIPSLEKFSTLIHLYSSIWQNFPSIYAAMGLRGTFCDDLLKLLSTYSIKTLPRKYYF